MAGIPFLELTNVVGAARSKFYKGFTETARIREYVLWQKMWKSAKSETAARRIEWKLRPNSGQGTTAELDVYEEPTYVRQSGMLDAYTIPCSRATHLNCIFNERELRHNSNGNKDKLYDLIAEQYSLAEEDRAEVFEALALNPPTDPASSKGNFVGLLGLFGRSMTAGGVFTRQTTPAFNGVYYRRLDGTISSTVYNVNRANAAASRARTLCATHDGSLNQTVLETIRACLRDSRFTFLPELRGDKPAQGDMMILWDDIMQEQYETLLSNLGTPRTRDYFNTGDVTVKGATCVAVPSFNGHFLRPIIGVNKSEFQFVKFSGAWNKPYEEPAGFQTMAYPHDNEFTSMCKSPRTAGFLIHGSFSTGT